MEFKSYRSLENSYRTKFMEKITHEMAVGRIKDSFVVTEKVHGANFSLWYDGTNLKGAKRSGFVGSDGENFYNSDIVKERYAEKVINLFSHLNIAFAGKKEPVTELVIFGELYGGGYPHPDVERVKNIKAVQSGIYYNPNIDFYAFDIVTNGEYMDADTAEHLFTAFGINYAKPLFKGTLEECLKYPNEFITTIPKDLGLPEIAGNTCEGVVIKPIKTAFLMDGTRVIIKNKNDKWSEKEKAPKAPKEKVVLSEAGQKLFAEGMSYVSDNRLKNVLSKWEGQVTDKDFGKLMGEMNKDAHDDFMKDFGDEFKALDPKEQKVIGKEMGAANAKLLRDQFLNIIDNTL